MEKKIQKFKDIINKKQVNIHDKMLKFLFKKDKDIINFFNDEQFYNNLESIEEFLTSFLLVINDRLEENKDLIEKIDNLKLIKILEIIIQKNIIILQKSNNNRYILNYKMNIGFKYIEKVIHNIINKILLNYLNSDKKNWLIEKFLIANIFDFSENSNIIFYKNKEKEFNKLINIAKTRLETLHQPFINKINQINNLNLNGLNLKDFENKNLSVIEKYVINYIKNNTNKLEEDIQRNIQRNRRNEINNLRNNLQNLIEINQNNLPNILQNNLNKFATKPICKQYL